MRGAPKRSDRRIVLVSRCLLGMGVLIAFASASWAASVPAPAEGDPFKVSKERFYAEVFRMALRPLIVPADVAAGDEVEAVVDRRLTELCSRLGFEVIAVDEFATRWKSYSEKLGGAYDPATGRPDEQTHAIVAEYTLRDLAEAFRADAVLEPSLVFRRMTPAWDSRSMVVAGEKVLFRGAPLLSARGYPQWAESVLGLVLRASSPGYRRLSPV